MELVEACLGLGEIERARLVLESVLTDFRKVALNERIPTALAYLKEVMRTPRGPEAARYVRTYVERLKTEPEWAFVPPPEHRDPIP